MKKKIIILFCTIFLIVGIIILLTRKTYSYKDKNTLYYKVFNNEILRYERYDYSLGQNQIVGVERSTNKGKTFKKITKEPIILSMEPMLVFLNEKLGFAISKTNLTKSNDYMGFKVTNDGGKTFVNAKINYDNPRIEVLTIKSVPYYKNNELKMKASIYRMKDDQSGYEDKELIFTSNDNGLTWNLEDDNKKMSKRKEKLVNLIKNEMINNGYLDSNNLKSFKVTEIYIYGYYKDEENKKYMQINFEAICNDISQKCFTNADNKAQENFTIWIITDEESIFEFKNGISLNKTDVDSGRYIMVKEIIE